MKIISRSLMCLAVVALVACAGTPVQKQVKQDLSSDRVEAEERLAQMTAEPEVYRRLDTPFVLGAPVLEDETLIEPEGLDEVVVYTQGASDGLAEAALYLARQSKVKITVAPDALARSREQAPGGIPISLTAPLRTFLGELCAASGTSWRWTGSEVLIYHRDVRSFRLHVVPPSIEESGTITNSSSSGATGGASSGGGSGGGQGGEGGGQSSIGAASSNEQTTTVSYTFDIFKDTEAAIRQMLSEGSTVSASPSTASLIVRGVATELDSVERYIGALNEQLKRQVVIELTVLTVDTKDEDNYGIDWNVLNSSGRAETEAVGISGLAGEGSSISATIVNPSSPFAGTNLVIEALRTQGEASVKRRNLITALDNQPTRVQSIIERPYQAGSQTALIPNAGTITTTLVGQQTTGFSLTLLPLVLDPQTILLQAQGSLSVPIERVVVGSEDNRTELLTRSLDDFVQRARLRTGQTLVLTGLDQIDREQSDRGVGSPNFKLLGGSARAKNQSRMLVIMLTVRSVG